MSSNEKLIRPGLWAPAKDLPDTKKRLRDKVPKPKDYELNAGCYYQVMLNYLYHNGVDKSADLIQKLVDIELERYKLAKAPRYLTISKKAIVELAETLKDIEMGNLTPMDLVHIAKELAQTKYHKWIAFELFAYALSLAEAIKDDEGCLEAQVRYAYAKCLLDTYENPKILLVISDTAKAVLSIFKSTKNRS